MQPDVQALALVQGFEELMDGFDKSYWAMKAAQLCVRTTLDALVSANCLVTYQYWAQVNDELTKIANPPLSEELNDLPL